MTYAVEMLLFYQEATTSVVGICSAPPVLGDSGLTQRRYRTCPKLFSFTLLLTPADRSRLAAPALALLELLVPGAVQIGWLGSVVDHLCGGQHWSVLAVKIYGRRATAAAPSATSGGAMCMLVLDRERVSARKRKPTKGTINDVRYKIAATREERASAFHLVHNAYVRAGIGKPNPWEMRVTPYHLADTTQILLATIRDEAILTMSVVEDGPDGLPIDSIFGDEVAERRCQAARIAEVGCLAHRRRGLRGFFPVFLGMLPYLGQFVRGQGIDQLVVTVHPKHAGFYERLLNFKCFGEEKIYPAVLDRPAVALYVDLTRLRDEHQAGYRRFFGEELSPEEISPRPITPADRAYFGPMVDSGFGPLPLGDEEDLLEPTTEDDWRLPAAGLARST